MSPKAADHEPLHRRRGEQLVSAIHRAVLEELAEVGFGGLTMQGVARRAGTGRAPLYRRWSSTEELAVEALTSSLPPVEPAPDTGDVREDLLILLRRRRDAIAGALGPAMIAVIAERRRHPRLLAAVRERLLETPSPTEQVLRRAAARGEIAADAITPEVCQAAGALLVVRSLMEGSVPQDAELAA
ncbi:MAG TPA: TetR/AcrR family transcriptional regulator, partial [Candidatus Dormibacteraeota bacterium]|nr:TetR/AcrR family transcriptional regulator [Candidatus Dormibacteraeota bacterium]